MQIFRIHSEVLNQEASVFVSEVNGKTVQTDDGVTYTNSELEILIRSRKPLPKEVHLVKKILGGKLIYQETKLWQKSDGFN